MHEGSITEPQAAAIGEIWKAFSIFFNTVSEDLRESLFLYLTHFSSSYIQRRCTCPRCLTTHHFPPPRQQWCGHTRTERVDIHTGYSPAAYVRYSLSYWVQRGCWEAGSCDEGVVGDVDSESSGWCAGDADSAGCEAADIASFVLVLRFDIFWYFFYVHNLYGLNQNGNYPIWNLCCECSEQSLTKGERPRQTNNHCSAPTGAKARYGDFLKRKWSIHL